MLCFVKLADFTRLQLVGFTAAKPLEMSAFALHAGAMYVAGGATCSGGNVTTRDTNATESGGTSSQTSLFPGPDGLVFH